MTRRLASGLAAPLAERGEVILAVISVAFLFVVLAPRFAFAAACCYLLAFTRRYVRREIARH